MAVVSEASVTLGNKSSRVYAQSQYELLVAYLFQRYIR